MSTLALEVEPLAVDVKCNDETLSVRLADGREISVPVIWFPRLAKATTEERQNWRLIGGGIGIHWEEIDEDVAIETLLRIR